MPRGQYSKTRHQVLAVKRRAREPGASIAEILADPEARAFIASPVPMMPKPNEDEKGDRS